MYDKIAYGITDEMIKRAVNTMPVQSQQLSAEGTKANPAIQITPKEFNFGGGGFGSAFAFTGTPTTTTNQKPQVNNTKIPFISYPTQGTTPGVSRLSMDNAQKHKQEQDNAFNYFTRWWGGLSEDQKRGAMDPNFQWKGPHGAWFSSFIDQMRTRQAENSKTNPTVNPVQEGGNFSGRAYTPNAYALNSSRQPYSTFERGWLATPLSQEAIDYQRHMNTNSAYNQERARQAKIRQDALNAKTKDRWQEQYNTVNSQGKDFRDMPLYQEFARTQRSLFGKTWAEKGFTEDQIDDYLMRQFQHKMDNVEVKQASANILSLILPKDVLAKEKFNG